MATRNISIVRGRNTTAKQVITKQLGTPRGTNLRDAPALTNVSAPTHPMREINARSINQGGRDSVMD